MFQMLTFSANKLILRWFFFLAIFIIETLTITSNFQFFSLKDLNSTASNNPSMQLFAFSKDYWHLCFWVFGACLITATPHFKSIFIELIKQSQDYPWQKMLALQISVFTLFTAVTAFTLEELKKTEYLTTFWFAIWAALGGLTVILWLLALAPRKLWIALIHRFYKNLAAGIVLGIFVGLLIEMYVRHQAPLAQKDLWAFLSGLTLQVVFSLLSLFYTDLIYEPEALVVGTSTFPVEITYFCSGIEGISLISVFLIVYLSLFRKTLRFPHVFWLFPIGILAIWLANGVRIAILIAIGHSFSREIAGMAFHAQAGWIAFTLVAVCLISLAHHMRFFSTAGSGTQRNSTGNILAIALLSPWIAQIATLMVTSAFTNDFDLLYPIRIFVICAVLIYYRSEYKKLEWNGSWEAPLIGGVVFIIWIFLEPEDQTKGAALINRLKETYYPYDIIWIIFRIAGSVVVVPLAEELAFRGYLIRKLISNDFENIPPQTFTWLSFLGSSISFGVLHERWIAGILAGMGYALILYRRGSIGDAVVAHMTSNALIAFFVLAFGNWSLWT